MDIDHSFSPDFFFVNGMWSFVKTRHLHGFIAGLSDDAPN
jgi:hypothetical protein